MTIWQFILWSLLKVAVVTVVFLTAVAYTMLLERKLLGHIQNRWGPIARGAVRAVAAAGGRGEIAYLKRTSSPPVSIGQSICLLPSSPWAAR